MPLTEVECARPGRSNGNFPPGIVNLWPVLAGADRCGWDGHTPGWRQRLRWSFRRASVKETIQFKG